jgi:hypothetical protein
VHGNIRALTFFDSCEAIFNMKGGDYEFRIKGDNVDNLFLTDPDMDRIGIKIELPESVLHINGSLSLPIRIATTMTTATADDYTIVLTSDATKVTLPHVENCEGRIYSIINEILDINDTTVCNDGDSIRLDGISYSRYVGIGRRYTIQSDGDHRWYVIQY